MSHHVDNYRTMLADNIVEGQVNFTDLEKELFSVAKKIGRQLFKKALDKAEEKLFEQKPSEYESGGLRKRTVSTILGDITIKRRVWKRKEEVSGKNIWKYKLDNVLGLESHQTTSLGLQEIALSMGAEKSFRKASALMKGVDLNLSHGKIHDLIQQAGEQIRAYEHEQADKHGSRGAELVVVESDGIQVHRQQRNRPKDKRSKRRIELKVGIIYDGWKATDPSGSSFRLKNKRIMGTEGDSDQYWCQMDRMLQSRYDVGRVDHFLFGSDGAAWGKKGAEMYGRSIHQVDAFHFQRNIKRTFGFEQQSMVDTIQSLVEVGDQQGFRTLMQSSRASFEGEEKKLNKVDQLETFILNNWESIPDYRLRGYDLPDNCRGTGSIENSVDILVADRMKKQGMAWSEAGAGNLVRVRAAIANGYMSEAISWVRTTEESRQEPAKELVTGKIHTGWKRPTEEGAWLQAQMPAMYGSEQNMREFASSLQNLMHDL